MSTYSPQKINNKNVNAYYGGKEMKIMSSYCYGGSVRMNPEIEEKERDPMFDEGYPFKVPKVYLEGCGEVYNRQYCFNWDDDSVVVVRDKRVIKYTRSTFVELLARNEEGEIVWMDGRCAPYSDCWKGEYLNEERGACEYTIEEYNLETLTKRKFKVVLDEETEFDAQDYRSLSNFVDADKLSSHFEIKDGVLLEYIGHDKELIIPEGVTELGYNVFWDVREFDNITIPSTLTKIYHTLSEHCRVKEVKVSEDNTKYYTMNGCLIDKENGELVWAYATDSIPCDDSIHKIGAKAFYGHKDIEHIEIPDNITEVGSYDFYHCSNLKTVTFSNSGCIIGDGCFSNCTLLSMVKLPELLTEIRSYTFAECKALETLDVPGAVKRVERDAWGWGKCEDLKKINISDDLIDSLKKDTFTCLVRKEDKWGLEVLPKLGNFEGFFF